MKLDRILVPLDGSHLSEAVLPQLAPLLEKAGAAGPTHVTLLTRIEPRDEDAEYPVGGSGVSIRADDLSAAMEGYLARTADLVRAAGEGVDVTCRVEFGPAAEGVLEVAAETQAGLIALSTHGRSGVARWRYGSVAEKILRASDVPVLVMRSFDDGEVGEDPRRAAPDAKVFSKILVPVDGSEVSLGIAEAVGQLGRLFDARVHLLLVDDADFQGDIPDAESSKVLAGCEEAFRERGTPVEAMFRRGDVAATIVETAAEIEADLVAMTTHGRSGVRRWVLGSVAERVLRAAKTPILLVRVGKKKSRSSSAEKDPGGKK